ncbi:MAG TPA: protein-disulfide reductase DsbD domain-containing protein [Ferruginibacter sp.]|nr:protein-disulfide reductase DsbD domain-containing protein [Ferruginibacter sp.]
MKKIYFLILSIFIVAAASAQIENPVKWSYTAKKISDKVYDVYVTATLSPKWHIYAQDAGEGPEPTSLMFGKNPLLKLDGKVKEEGKIEKQYDENFKSELKFYSNKVSFVQRVKLKSTVSTVIKGSINYMVCNDRKCLPPKEIPFAVKLPGK